MKVIDPVPRMMSPPFAVCLLAARKVAHFPCGLIVTPFNLVLPAWFMVDPCVPVRSIGRRDVTFAR